MLPFSEACERNKGPILEVLRDVLALRTRVLEIGSGTGQHAIYFARNLEHLIWYPTERLSELDYLEARIKAHGGPNVRPPLLLDVRQPVWPVSSVDAMFTANTFHIMSWDDVRSLFEGIGATLKPGGVFCVYGPFREGGHYTSPSNRDFDLMLQERNAASGLREIEEVAALAARIGLRLAADHDMPAHNRLLIFLREPA